MTRGTDARLAAAFAEAEHQGLVLATRLRLGVLAVIAAWTVVENRGPGGLYYFWLTVAFALFGVVPLALRRAGVRGAWPAYVLPVLDVGLFTFAVLIPNPFDPDPVPTQMRLRFGNELYLFLFPLGALLTYSPGVVLWTGVVAAAAWSVGTLWILLLPDSLGYVPGSAWRAMTSAEVLATILDPRWVNVGLWGRQAVLLVVFGGFLAVVVRRSRRLVERQVEAERARTNLARYFSPNLVEELARSDEPLRTTRAQRVAVLFADLVGFTTLSADRPPEAVIGLLRGFHRRMASAVFAHGGTVDKYLGDGLMVSFGTPRPGPRDATDALRCARAMLGRLAEWNAERVGEGETALRMGIGLHYGPVVLGDIGDERHLEFAVVGDSVNLASRLQELTREVGAPLLVSQAVVEAVRADGGGEAELTGLVEVPPQQIRGYREAVRVWAERDGGRAA